MRRHLKKYLPDPAIIKRNRWLGPLSGALMHPRLWHLNRHSAAGAVAAGLFCGLIPGPFQMLGAAICALLFRVNLPLALFVTLYTNPFTIVPLYLLAYQIGHFASGDPRGFTPPPELTGHDPATWAAALLNWMEGVGKPLGIGLLLLGSSLAVLGYLAVKLGWRIYLMRAWRRRLRS